MISSLFYFKLQIVMNEELFLASDTIEGIVFEITVSDKGVREICINRKPGSDSLSEIAHISNEDSKISKVFTQLREYFKRQRKEFDLPLEILGTDFRKAVWNELKKIPYGKTINYGELAKRMGDKKLMRAVASANGANPIPIIIPCHRVIGGDGSLTGYGGGVDVKQKLLELEGSWSLSLFK